MIDKTRCPFCGEEVKTKYYIRYEDWTCGCFNPKCKIQPKSICVNTEEKAKQEWESAFVQDRRR